MYDKFRGLREIGWCAGNALYRIAEAEGGYFGFQIPDSRNLPNYRDSSISSKTYSETDAMF